MRKATVLIAALSMAGCMTCREHPVACAIGTGIVVGSVAAIVEHQHDQHDRRVGPTSGPLCAPFCAVQ